MIAPSDTLQIVRWRPGEDEIWMRVPYPCDEWLAREGEPVLPSEDHPVRFVLGLTGQASADLTRGLFERGKSNLPFNRDDQGQAADTCLFVDTRSSSFALDAVASTARELDVYFFGRDLVEGVMTEADPTRIHRGLELPIPFVGDSVLAHAVPLGVRMLPHLPKEGGGFHATLSISNLSGEPQPVALQFFRADGSQLDGQTVFLASWEQRQLDLSAEEMACCASYARVLNHSKTSVEVLLSASTEQSLPTFLTETRQLLEAFSIHPSSIPGYFDGVAAVNMGDYWTDLRFSAYSQHGDLLGTLQSDAFPPHGKLTMVLNPVYEAFPEADWFHVSSVEPITVVVLRGTVPGHIPSFLFSVPMGMEP